MIVKYEKISDKEIDGELSKTIEIVNKKDATHKHICRHDEVPPKACSREKI